MELKKIFNKVFWGIFAVFAAIEVLSFSGSFYPSLNKFAFAAIILAALILSFKNIKYGLWLCLADLFLDSKGYLFFLSSGGFGISLRSALWIIIMSVWLANLVLKLIKKEGRAFLLLSIRDFKENKNLTAVLIVILFISWGIIRGVLEKHGFSDLFFDFNGWLYFLLVFPLFDSFSKQEEKDQIFLFKIFAAAVFFLSLKTFFLLFIFSHNISWSENVYSWLRTNLLGEVTRAPNGLLRIFFQTHFYSVLGFIFIFTRLIFRLNKKFVHGENFKKKDFGAYLFLLSLALGPIILSFSRSFWLALAIVLLLALIFIPRCKFFKTFLALNGFLAAVLIISLSLIFLTAYFPYPARRQFDLSKILENRLKGNEEAISSRYDLLPPLKKEIIKNPILGQGFGATVTFYSRDPRVLEESPSGLRTTYALEWGWLDVWLKIGLFGLLAYFLLFWRLFISKWKEKGFLGKAISLSLIFLFIANIFTPYVNHPLGIGFIILAAVLNNHPDN